MDILKCKSVETKSGQNGPYYYIQTEDGKKFNLFDPKGAELKPGDSFTAEFTVTEKNNKRYLNVVMNTFALSPTNGDSTSRSASPQYSSDKDRSIERQAYSKAYAWTLAIPKELRGDKWKVFTDYLEDKIYN